MTTTSTPDLHRLFHPQSVAVVGASTKRGYTWDSGNAYINGCIRQSFNGRLYPVHPKAESILGYQCYGSILDIPEPVDLAIICIRASAAKHIIEECVQKGVRFVHMLTAGFGETGQATDAGVEEEIMAIARKAGLRIVGPNCMGLYAPEGGLAWNGELPGKPGSVGLFSQSGQLANMVVRTSAQEGIHFSKVASFGNASDLQAHEFLEYLGNDPKTGVISGYIEGLKEGRAFFEAAKNVTPEKRWWYGKEGRQRAGLGPPVPTRPLWRAHFNPGRVCAGRPALCPWILSQRWCTPFQPCSGPLFPKDLKPPFSEGPAAAASP